MGGLLNIRVQKREWGESPLRPDHRILGQKHNESLAEGSFCPAEVALSQQVRSGLGEQPSRRTDIPLDRESARILQMDILNIPGFEGHTDYMGPK